MMGGDYHVHTTYCDGNDTPAAMVEAALARGMTILGFSGHAHMACDESYCMSPDATAAYKAEIAALRETYRGRLEILCGIEQDLYSDLPCDDYDYVIGSVHNIRCGEDYMVVDAGAEEFEKDVAHYFSGDYYRAVEAYYAEVKKLPTLHPSFIGHFDLITKFNQNSRFFDEEDPRYRAAAAEALDVLLSHDIPLEINTGAMSRGFRDHPYPAPHWIRYIGARGGRVILCGDVHRSDGLQFAFKTWRNFALSCGCRVIERP